MAFADVEGQDKIHGFIITENRELYTLNLESDLFRSNSTVANDLFKKCAPSYFTLNRPFRLHAGSPYELFVTFENGTLQRLTRKADDDGTYGLICVG